MKYGGRVTAEYWALQRQGRFTESLAFLRREAKAGSVEAKYELSQRRPSHTYEAQVAAQEAAEAGYLPALATEYNHVLEAVTAERGVLARIMSSDCAWSKWVLNCDNGNGRQFDCFLREAALAGDNVHAMSTYAILVGDNALIRTAADAGHEDACVEMGQVLWDQGSYDEAFHYIQVAAAQENVLCNEFCANRYFGISDWLRAAQHLVRAWHDKLGYPTTYQERCLATIEPHQRSDRTQELYVYARAYVREPGKSWLADKMPIDLGHLYVSVTSAARSAAIAVYHALKTKRASNRDVARLIAEQVWASRHTHSQRWFDARQREQEREQERALVAESCFML